MRPIDSGRIAQVTSVEQYLPLFDALKEKPSHAERIQGTPFKWWSNNVEYSSSCAAFDRNMWIIGSIADHWNALGAKSTYSDMNAKHVVPLVKQCNFLLNTGLEEDMTRPSGAEEAILPMLMQRSNLTAMRNAGIAVGWQNMAEAVVIGEDEEKAPKYHIKGKMLLESAKAATEANPFLKGSFVKAREIEAGGAFAEQWKEQSEDTPMTEYSIKAHSFYSAVASEIGFGLMHNAQYSKRDALRGAAVCAGDLVEIHNVKSEDLAKTVVKKSLKALLGEELQRSGTELEKVGWMTESDASCFKDTGEIRLA